MSLLRAFAFVARLSFLRQLRSRKTALAAGICLLLVVAVALLARGRPWDGRTFANAVVLRMLGLFLLPLTSLIFGSAAIGDELDERTLVYHATRPLPRWALYLAKHLGVLPLGLLFPLGCLKLLEASSGVAAPADGGLWGRFAPALGLGAFAYLAFFQALSIVLRRATLVSLAYVFFVEVFVGRMPGILKRGSISFYTWSMIFEAGAPLGLDPPERGLFLPISADAAAAVLVGAALALLAIGMALFEARGGPSRSG